MAESNIAGRVLAFSLFAATAVLSYQAWSNTRPTPETHDLAKAHACDLDGACIVTDDSAHAIVTDVFKRRYGFNTNQGKVTVTCKRELIFFGSWTCTPAFSAELTTPL